MTEAQLVNGNWEYPGQAPPAQDPGWDLGGTGFLPGFGPEAPPEAYGPPVSPATNLAESLRQVFDAVVPGVRGESLASYLNGAGQGNLINEAKAALERYAAGDRSALATLGQAMDNIWRTAGPGGTPLYQQMQSNPRVQALGHMWTQANASLTALPQGPNAAPTPNPQALPRTPTPGQATPTITPARTTPAAATPDPNAAFQPGGPVGPPITLTGPGAETPFGQVAGQVLNRGYLPAFNFLELMANAEHQRLADEQQRLINAASIAAQQGNMELATQNAIAARGIAERQQSLAEGVERGRHELDLLNSSTQRDVARREMGLREQVTPYEATTQRMVGMAPLATSPLVGWYTARGEAPPQAIQDLLRSATQTPGAVGTSLSSQSVLGRPVGEGNTAGGTVPYSAVPANPDPNSFYIQGTPEIPATSGKTLDGTMSLMSPLRQGQTAGVSTGGAPFMRALNTGATMPVFTGSVGQFAPPLPGGAQWASMTPGEKTGTQDLFASFGIPKDDFASMLAKSLPPGGDMSAAARFASAVR